MRRKRKREDRKSLWLVNPGINSTCKQYDFSKCRTRKRRRYTPSKRAASNSTSKPDEDNTWEFSTLQSVQPLYHESYSADILPPEEPTANPSAVSSTSLPQESPLVCHSDVCVVYKLVYYLYVFVMLLIIYFYSMACI